MNYLDNAATTLVKPPGVSRAVRDALRYCGGPGRGGHSAARYASDVVYECRSAVGEYFNMEDSDRVIFTCNCTHALNTAIKGLVRYGKRVVVSGLEHNAVMRPLYKLSEEKGIKITVLPTPLFEPEVALHQFEQAIGADVCLVVCTHVSNVFGYILPVQRLNELCKSRKVPLIIDAAQSAGCIPIEGDSGPIWCMPGHKGLYGPQGTGLMLLPPGLNIDSLIEGGTGTRSFEHIMPSFMPDRLEAGTQNAHGIAGLKEGILYVTQHKNEIMEHEQSLIGLAVSQLSGLKGIRVFDSPHLFCQSGVLSITLEGMDSEKVTERLAEADIAVRGGYHCAPNAHEQAGTIASGTVRMSVSHFTSPRDVRAFTSAVKKICKLSENLER